MVSSIPGIDFRSSQLLNRSVCPEYHPRIALKGVGLETRHSRMIIRRHSQMLISGRNYRREKSNFFHVMSFVARGAIKL
jgi:hypothetical protein